LFLELKQLKQTRSTNPFRPGSGILPPLLAGRERETAIFEARVARTREGQPQHTALLGEWAIGKTTLLMHWRRLRQQAGDAVVLSMAYPQSSDEFLAGLVNAIDAELATDGPRDFDVELGLDIGVANARIRRRSRDPERELRAALRRLIEHRARDGRSVIVLLDDVDLLPMTGDVLLRLRACALELYAADLPLALLVAASSGLFDGVRSAHEPLVRFFEPLYLGPLEPGDATRAIIEPVEETMVRFDPEVVAEIVDLAGGRPYYLQKLGYFAFDAAVDGRVTRAEFAVASSAHSPRSARRSSPLGGRGCPRSTARSSPLSHEARSHVHPATSKPRLTGSACGRARLAWRFVVSQPGVTSTGSPAATAAGTRFETGCFSATWSCRRASGNSRGSGARPP